MSFSNVFVSECRERSTYFRHVAAPVFRKSFTMGACGCGEVTICGLGFYDLFVNGQKITKGYLAPYVSNPDHLDYYDYYDITPYLCEGENVIGVMLGDGYQNNKTSVWDFDKIVFNAAPKLAITVSVSDSNAAQQYDAMDFHCKKGPVWFNDLRSGVFFDKRMEETGWSEPGFVEDAQWHTPILSDAPRGTAKLCEAEPIVVTREIKPVRITKGSLAPFEPREDVQRWLADKGTQECAPVREGGWIYDFGENNAGIFRLKIRGHRGQRIDIQCAEQLLDGMPDYNNINFFPDGYVQRDIYIVGSEEEEVFEPMFTYHGFRYLYVSGIDESQATPELLTYLVQSSDLETRGSFHCSDPMANQIFAAARRSDVSNFFYFPTDCPHREKHGWTGDAQTSAEHMMMTMGTEKSWREWLNNIRLAQKSDGMIPGFVPTDACGYDWGNGPGFDRILFELPYMIWKYRGDTLPIAENAHAMLEYLEYISRKRNQNGIISVGLGDLVPVGRTSFAYQVPVGFTDSVMVYWMCHEAEQMFDAVHLPMHSRFAKQLGEEVRAAVRKQYMDLHTMTVQGRCQTGQAMGIFYGIFEAAEQPEAFRRLMQIIRRDGEIITCGIYGLRVLFHVLASFGEAELAYRMITDTEYPSYGYFIQKGMTTLPEHLTVDEARVTLSQNHHFLGDVVNWYMRWPGGIQVENSRKVCIRPQFIRCLNDAEASHTLPDGEVRVHWQRNQQGITLELACPAQVECAIDLPVGWQFEETGTTYAEGKNGVYSIVPQ